jgi:MFS transporter, DHA1 family, multidrug resistance protein B
MKQIFKFNKTIQSRMILNFFQVVGSAMVMPYSVVYFSNKISAALTTATILLVGVFSLLGYLIGGRCSDHIGRKKVIIVSELVSGISFILISYFDSFFHFYAIPIILSFMTIYFFESAANPAYSALIIDASDENNRSIIYTYFMWISNVAFAIGSILGGFFFEKYSPLLFFLVGASSILSAFCTCYFIKDTYIQQSKIVQNTIEKDVDLKKEPFKMMRLFASRVFVLLCIGNLLINLLSEQFPNYLSIRIVSNYPFGDITGYHMIGYLHVVDTVITVFAVGVILKSTSSLSEKGKMILGLLLFILGYICLSYFLQPIFLLFGMVLISIGRLIYYPTLQSITAKIIPEETRGTHLSILGLLAALGGILSSLFILGMEYITEMGITTIFICLGTCIIFNYVSAYRFIKKEYEKE